MALGCSFRTSTWLSALAFAAATLLSAVSQTARAEALHAKPLTIFAAASLKTVIDKIAATYHAHTGQQSVASYAGSSALAKQIERGAPADIFISADTDWMDYLGARKLIDRATRVDLLSNSLVLIAPASSTTQLTIAQGVALADALGTGRLALADTAAVPAGKYAKAALNHFGVWPEVAHQLAEAENVRAALALVARDEAAFGIVYATDAQDEPKVRIVAHFPPASHPLIVYPVAITAATENPDAAKAFVAFLGSPAARSVFEQAGFKVLVKHGS